MSGFSFSRSFTVRYDPIKKFERLLYNKISDNDGDFTDPDDISIAFISPSIQNAFKEMGFPSPPRNLPSSGYRLVIIQELLEVSTNGVSSMQPQPVRRSFTGVRTMSDMYQVLRGFLTVGAFRSMIANAKGDYEDSDLKDVHFKIFLAA